MKKHSSLVRSAALAAAIAVGATVAPAAVFAPVAVAQGTDDASTITKDKGTLTIHKKANPTNLGTPTGNEDTSVTGTDLDGVEFTIYKINNIDMSTNAGLAAAAGKTAAEYIEGDKVKSGAPVTQVAKEVTQNGGKIVLDQLPIGAYLVVETGPKEGYSPAAPFIAFVPMTQNNAGENQGTTWNYDVHAYPKNYEKKQPVKTVKDEAQNVGGTIEYNIDTTVRTIGEGKRLKYYFIEDTLDAKNLKVAEAQIAVTIDGQTAAKDTDYTLTKNDETGHFQISLTVAGLKKLKSGSEVNVNVKAEKITDGPVIPNTAREYEPSNPSTDMDVTDNTEPPKNPESDYYETPPVFTYFGEIDFTKVNNKGEGLQGAEFKVFRIKNSEECAAEAPKTGEVTAYDEADKKNDTIFNSASDGKVRIAGLHVNDFANNKDVAKEDQDAYCIYETKAPKGKELLSKGYKFQLLKSGEKTTVTKTIYKYTKAEGATEYTQTTEDKTYEVPVYKPVSWTVGEAGDGKVVNLDDTTPNLPMTGGMGIGILAAIGAAIIALGAFFARRSAKNS